MKEFTIRIKAIIKQHIINNSKEYIITTLIFALGIFLGVLFVNNIKDSTQTEIKEYLEQFVTQMKATENINNASLIKTSVSQNLLLTIGICFFGTTVIGIPIVLGIVTYRGFCFGYTLSACVRIFGISKGLVFVFTNMLLPSILKIPATLALSVSGLKLYKSIVKEKKKNNIKIEIIRHTVFSLIMLVIMLISSIVEVYICANILRIIIKYF